MENRSLGELIAEKRRERHMTQAALAAQFGISDKAVSKWERNLSRPEENHMVKLVELLDLPREYLSKEDATIEKEYLPPQFAEQLHKPSPKWRAHPLSLHDVICMTAIAVLLALSVSISTDFLTVEQSVPIMGICNVLFAWGTLWGME